MEQIKFNTAPEKVEQKENSVLEKLAQRIKDIFKRDPQETETETETRKREEELSNFYEQGFDVYEKLKQVRGPFIEVAGPTEGGYKLVDIQKLGRKLTISNQSKSWAKGKIDFEASATDLPMKDGSIGALFVSCIGGMQKDDPEELKKLTKKISSWRGASEKESQLYNKLSRESKRRLRNGAIEEAYRVLEDKGLLIWQGGEKKDFEKALVQGFKIKVLRDRKEQGVGYDSNNPSYNFIFEKGKPEPESPDSSQNPVQSSEFEPETS